VGNFRFWTVGSCNSKGCWVAVLQPSVFRIVECNFWTSWDPFHCVAVVVPSTTFDQFNLGSLIGTKLPACQCYISFFVGIDRVVWSVGFYIHCLFIVYKTLDLVRSNFVLNFERLNDFKLIHFSSFSHNGAVIGEIGGKCFGINFPFSRYLMVIFFSTTGRSWPSYS
jgi:hypothetical protein